MSKTLRSYFIMLALSLGIASAALANTEKDLAQGTKERAAGEKIFHSHCAACHENTQAGAPHISVLHQFQPEDIYTALTRGRMQAQAVGLSDAERRVVAEFLGGRKIGAAIHKPLKMCQAGKAWFDTAKPSVGTGWGVDPENTRLVSFKQAGISRANVKNLKLRWTFAFPNASEAVAQPLVAGGGLFVGSQDGTVYALNADTGCVYWTYKARGQIVGAIVPYYPSPDSVPILIVGDRLAHVHAIDAASGRLLWKQKVDDHPAAVVTGSPTVFDDRVYVPVSSFEESAAAPTNPCCTFRGSVVALNPTNGNLLWRSYTIPNPATVQYSNEQGVPRYGPSGAAVWITPAVDRKRNRIYIATSNNYSDPGDENSDGIRALDAKTGETIWRIQTTPEPDVYNNWDYWCRRNPAVLNAPDCKPDLKKEGPDVSMNGPPILVNGQGGEDMVIAGRKDGTVFGVRASDGKIVWSTRNTPGATWDIKTLWQDADALWYGMAAQDDRIYVPSLRVLLQHVAGKVIPSEESGLHALDAHTGKLLWIAKVSNDCDKSGPCLGLASTPIGVPGVVFAGSVDGFIRAYDSESGKVLWRYDTAREFLTLSGDVGKGGGVGRNGIMIANGVLYVGSGFYHLPGNVLLAFSVDGDTSSVR